VDRDDRVLRCAESTQRSELIVFISVVSARPPLYEECLSTQSIRSEFLMMLSNVSDYDHHRRLLRWSFHGSVVPPYTGDGSLLLPRRLSGTAHWRRPVPLRLAQFRNSL